MKRHTNIGINRFTNFLKQGAFVRRQGFWTLLFDPADEPNADLPSTIKTDFLTSAVLRKYYKNQWDISENDFKTVIDQTLVFYGHHKEKITIEWQDIERSPFDKSFELGQSGIRAGEVKKFVPIALQTGKMGNEISDFQKLIMLRKLAQLPPALYPYGEWAAAKGFMGASPEVFLELNDLDLNTTALAGTSSKDIDPKVFFNDAKERKEHQFVIDDIKEQLAAIGHVTIGPTEVVEFPWLNHLKTPISARLFKTIDIETLIKKLHPTAALGVFPRHRYFKKFSQFPLQQQRDFFGAPWGIESNKRLFAIVAIRKWDWSAKDVKIYAGCGVVQESVIEKEFAEIIKKIDSVKRLFFQE